MIKAVGQRIIVTKAEKPESMKLETPDGKHPFAFEVVSIGPECDLAQENGDKVEVGDLVTIQGDQISGLDINEKTYCSVLSHQIGGVITDDGYGADEDDL